ncbi:MAG: hypothetical protein JO170_15605 [Verrucomicrobia bacterium]|nr:hypothetical protein [Verrucomicrobiota bacterium]
MEAAEQTNTAPRVFISYSHDSTGHKEIVLRFAERLRKDGVDAQIDQYVRGRPPEGKFGKLRAQIGPSLRSKSEPKLPFTNPIAHFWKQFLINRDRSVKANCGHTIVGVW